MSFYPFGCLEIRVSKLLINTQTTCQNASLRSAGNSRDFITGRYRKTGRNSREEKHLQS